MKENKSLLLKVLLFLGIVTVIGAFASTGGTEISPFWTEVSASLKGIWGKIIAALFIGLGITRFMAGGIISGFIFILMGLSVGSIPDIVDSKFTISIDTLENMKITASLIKDSTLSIIK